MKKTSALALAIAGTIAAPAVMAESGMYMSARFGVDMQMNDDATKESTRFRNMSSRMGWKSETDLGNGKTAYGKLEVDMGFGTRDLYAGLKGDFGDIRIAEKGYAAYYNNVSAPVDVPYWADVIGIGDENSRSNNFISYIGGTDAFSFEVTGEANGTDSTTTDGNTGLSGYQVGASFGLGDWTLGLGARNAEDDAVRPTAGTVSGVTLSGNLGDVGLAVSFNTDDDTDGLQLYAAFGSFFAEYGQQDVDATDSSLTSISLGWSTSIGRNTSVWAEYGTRDYDGTQGDEDEVGVALRYDWN